VYNPPQESSDLAPAIAADKAESLPQGDVMKLSFAASGGFLLVPFLCLAWQQTSAQQTQSHEPKETPVSSETASSTDQRNPVKPTPANLADAKKFFGFDCAMCHGVSGDGKGDLAASMSLKMNDWHESAVLAKMPDGEIFNLIVKGKGKMEGEGNRVSSEKAWELVNYVRSLAKNDAAVVPKSGASR
jgi:mono/diheme cytochrome c family protein